MKRPALSDLKEEGHITYKRLLPLFSFAQWAHTYFVSHFNHVEIIFFDLKSVGTFKCSVSLTSIDMLFLSTYYLFQRFSNLSLLPRGVCVYMCVCSPDRHVQAFISYYSSNFIEPQINNV